MSTTLLAAVSSWALVALGACRVVFGLVKYRKPLGQAIASGFIGKFAVPEQRRTAFWFVLFGLPLLLSGHVAVRAAGSADLAMLRLVGGYVCATSLIGIAAFPRSPFTVSLVLSVLLLLAGFEL